MWGLSKKKERAKVAPETLQEQLTALQGEFRSLKAEWLDIYDKFYRLAGRMDATKRWIGERQGSPSTPAPENVEPAPTEEQTQGIPSQAPDNGRPATRRELLASLVR